MSTTYGELKTRIATILNDPSGKTFTASLLAELAIAGIVEVGRIAPRKFAEDIDVVENTRIYNVASDFFAVVPEPDVEVVRVEIWDTTTDPDSFISAIEPSGTEASPHDSGWEMWVGGRLVLPTRVVRALNDHIGSYVIKVKGYAAYDIPTDDADVIPASAGVEQAMVKYARVEGLEMLNSQRDLFTQWQTRSGNSDISPAGLMNQLSNARADWDKYSKRILVLRSVA